MVYMPANAKAHTRAELAAAIAKIPLTFHKVVIPAHPTTDPDTGRQFMLPESVEVTGELRMRQVVHLNAAMGGRTPEEIEELAHINLRDWFNRWWFDVLTGDQKWPET